MFRSPTKPGPNLPCPGGSGKKYKKCCRVAHRAVQGAATAHDRIETLMQQGYQASEAHRSDRACDRWNDTWQLIRAHLEPDMRTCEQAEAVFNGSQLIFNWLSDFSTELLNATLVDGPRFGEIGVRFCNEVLEQFTDESDNFKTYFRGDLGDLLCRAGRFEEGEQVFLQLIRDAPDSAIGYVKLADALLDIKSEGRARSLLEQAREKPDADHFDVARRLADFFPTSATTE